MKPADVRNLYERLGITKGASPDDIRKAFRSLAVEWHPDTSAKLAREKDKGLQYRAVQKAYDILSDSDKRTQYDAYLERRTQPTANGPFIYYARTAEEFSELLRRHRREADDTLRRAEERIRRSEQERQEVLDRIERERKEREARWKDIEKQREREMRERLDRLELERREREAIWKDTKKENPFYKNLNYSLRPDYKNLEYIIYDLNKIRRKK